MNNTIRSIVITICMFGTACGPAAWCAETGAAGDSNVSQLIVGKFGLGIAAGVYRFTSSYRLKLEDRVPIFIDGEGTLGLEETTVLPILYGRNIAGRHGIGFRYFRIDRKGSDLAIDRQFESLSIDGVLTARDQSSFYQLNYFYAFQSNENLLLRGLVGLYTLDLKFRFDATGKSVSTISLWLPERIPRRSNNGHRCRCWACNSGHGPARDGPSAHGSRSLGVKLTTSTGSSWKLT